MKREQTGERGESGWCLKREGVYERVEREDRREIEGRERESRDERGVICEREEGDVREERQREWIWRGERGRKRGRE